MSENNASSSDSTNLVVPSFGGIPEIKLDMTKIRIGESRLIEAKMVNPLTYTDLEHDFNEAYRDLKRHLSTVGYQIALAEKAMESAKANILLDKYPEYLKDKPKSHDNGDLRKAFMMRDPEYLSALDRINQLKALESFLDGKIKVMENVCRYMRKGVDLILRSGVAPNYYVTSGKK